jgi:hypothetical protein
MTPAAENSAPKPDDLKLSGQQFRQ